MGTDIGATSLRDIREEKVRRLTEERFRYYEPNGKCEEFIAKVGSGDHFVVLFSAANGVGKTAAGANVVAHIAYGSDNPYFDHPLFRDWQFPKAGRIVTDHKNVRNVLGTLREWLPRGRYTAAKGGYSYEATWDTDSGFTWDVMTYDQDPRQFEGPTLGWVWFDEPPPEEIYKACVSRLRKGGIIFITATPLAGSSWMYDHIIGGHDLDVSVAAQRAYVEADVEAACREHGERGHLAHADIERMVAEYSEDEKQARVYGKFQHLVGLVFKSFSRRVHVVKPFQLTPDRYTVYEALDPHRRTPDACLWVAVDRAGRRFVVDELWLRCQGGTPELAQRILAKATQYRIGWRIVDPWAFDEDQHTGRSLAADLAERGLSYIAAPKARGSADRSIEDALACQEAAGVMVQPPTLYVFDTCQRLIYELEHYRWDEWSGKTADRHGQKEKPVDRDDHMVENLGRILFKDPPFLDPERRRERPDAGRDEDDPYG